MRSRGMRRESDLRVVSPSHEAARVDARPSEIRPCRRTKLTVSDAVYDRPNGRACPRQAVLDLAQPAILRDRGPRWAPSGGWFWAPTTRRAEEHQKGKRSAQTLHTRPRCACTAGRPPARSDPRTICTAGARTASAAAQTPGSVDSVKIRRTSCTSERDRLRGRTRRVPRGGEAPAAPPASLSRSAG